MFPSGRTVDLTSRWPFSARRIRKYIIIFIAINIIFIFYIIQSSRHASNDNKSSDIFESHLVEYKNITTDIFHLPLYQNSEMSSFYFSVEKKHWCFKGGTLHEDSEKSKGCICKVNWFGSDCGIPKVVWSSSYLEAGLKAGAWVKRRECPRRIICVILYSGYPDFLELQLRYLHEVVDVFVIGEFVKRNSSFLLDRFYGGYLQKYKNKVVYVDISSISGQEDQLWNNIWKRISDFRPDDLIFMTKASAIPLVEVLLFMKLYDGFSEPVILKTRPLIYNFLWEMKKQDNFHAKYNFLTSFATTSSFCRYNRSCVLSLDSLPGNSSKIQHFEEANGWKLKRWLLGSSLLPSGWDCHQCLRISNSFSTFNITLNNTLSDFYIVKWKKVLLDAINSQKNFSLDFVQEVKLDDPYLAPNFLLENPGHLWYLLPLGLNQEEIFLT